MKILPLFLLISFFLVSCTGEKENNLSSIQQTKKVSEIQNDQEPTRKVQTQTVSAETDYAPQKNLINLGTEESEIIAKKLIEKSEKQYEKPYNTGSIIEGSWKAVYNPPKYPDGYDSIILTMSGKIYTLPGVYGKEERDKYLKAIREGTGFISHIQGPIGEYGTTNVLIDGVYYYPPTDNDYALVREIGTFGYFSSFLTGYYLTYHVYYPLGSEDRIIDIRTKKNILDNKDDSLVYGIWTPDHDQVLYYSAGWSPNIPEGFYLTQVGDFLNADKILDGRKGMISYDIDQEYIYILEEYTDYYLRIIRRSDYQEVYTRIIKK